MGENQSAIEKLERDGWTRRFIADEPRLSEAAEVYRDSGFDVHLEPLPEGEGNETSAGEGDAGVCRICFEGTGSSNMILFTRPRKPVPEEDEGSC